MADAKWFDSALNLPISEYPTDFIPNGGIPIIGTDWASPNSDTSVCVRGFYEDGILHIQSVTPATASDHA